MSTCCDDCPDYYAPQHAAGAAAWDPAAVQSADRALLRSFAESFMTAGYHVGDCDFMHPWDCVTSAFDAIKSIPGIGAVAQLAEDFSNTTVGKIFFAMIAPSIAASFFTSLPGIGMQVADTLGKLGPVATDMLPGLVRGERTDKVFVASLKSVIGRAASAGGAQGAAEAAQMAGPYLEKATTAAKAALESMGTTPKQIASMVDAKRIQAGLKTAEDVLPPQLQAELDAQIAPYLAQLDVHALALRAGVPDDMMQVAIDGVTRTMNYDPSNFLADGRNAARVAENQRLEQARLDRAAGSAFLEKITLTNDEFIQEPAFRDWLADLTAGTAGRDNLPGSSPVMSPRAVTAIVHKGRPLYRYPAAFYALLTPQYVIDAAISKGNRILSLATMPNGPITMAQRPAEMARAAAYLSAAERGANEERQRAAEDAAQRAANAQAITTPAGMRERAAMLMGLSVVPGSGNADAMRAEARTLLERAAQIDASRMGVSRAVLGTPKAGLDEMVRYYVAIAQARGLAA